MPNSLTHHLVRLISALTKADKRRFSLYCSRQQKKEGKNYLSLFKFIDKYQRFDQEQFLQKHPSIKVEQLSNLKRNLFDLLLTTLRMGEQSNDNTIQIREWINQGKTLFNLGLYQQSLWVLQKAKEKAKKWDLPVLELEIIDLEKVVELHFVTGRPSNTAHQLIAESEEVVTKVGNEHLLSGLALLMYGYFVENGYVKNETEAKRLQQVLKKKSAEIPPFKQLNYHQKLYYYQTYFWYHYCLQDFLRCYRYAWHWVSMIEEYKQQKIEAAQYLKGLNSLLASLFRLNHTQQFVLTLEKLKKSGETNKKSLNRNEQNMLFKYLVVHRLNRYFMKGEFKEGITRIPTIEKQMEARKNSLDQRFINSIYYKFASLYFGFGNYQKASHYLSRILYKHYSPLREDIQSFSRILLTVCYYEMEDEFRLAQSIKSTYLYLGRKQDLNQFQKEIFTFLRKTANLPRHKLKAAFQELLTRMIAISKIPYEQRPFYYFDIISWLESKLERKTVVEIIKRRGLGHRRLFD